MLHLATYARWIGRCLAVVVAAGTCAAAQASNTGIVVSQIYGGNGNTVNADYVELFNAGAAAVTLAGWSVQYASATGTGNFVANGPINATMQPGQYLLVRLATSTTGAALPTPDVIGSTNISATAGKIALVRQSTGLACNGGSTACSASDLTLIEDLVGYGTANFFETTAAPAPSATTALFRAPGGCTDTNNNGADFTVGAPNPRNSASTLAACSANAPIVPACTAFNTVAAIAGSSAITATDADGVVNGASITAGAVAGISLGAFTSAATTGGTGSVRVEVTATVATGTYTPTVTFVNNQGQSASCVVTVTVQTPPATVTPTYSIQGSGTTSPLVAASVTTRGVVTGVFPGLLGYYIQDETGDGNALTSDGLFIFNNAAPITVAVGERVQVTGTVAEFAGFAGNPTVTELTNPTNVAKLGTGSIAPTSISLPEVVNGDLERYEGMLVSIAGPLTVSQNYFQGRYGQVTLSAGGRLIKPTNLFRPNTPAAIAQADENARRRIILDDGKSAESLQSSVENPNPIPYIGFDNTLRAGDTVTNLTGIIDFGRVTSDTGAAAIVDYKLQPTVPPTFTRVNNRTAAPPAVTGAIKVASFNVLNYFTTFSNGATAGGQTGQGCLPSNTTADCRGADNLAEFNRQRDKIVAAIKAIDADVVGLMEIQRNGTVAVQNLVDGINAAIGATTYAVVPDPAAGTGTDAIRVAMIYKPGRLTTVGASLADAGVINNRPPLAQTFRTANGAKFSVIVNHMKSKSCTSATGLDLDQGDGQGCYNDRRKQQASALLSFITTVKAAAGDDDVIVIGDLNAYAQEDPIDVLLSGGLSDQLARFNGLSDYSYVFDGEAGYIDHALASSSLAGQIKSAVHWHINADEPSVIDYNTEFKPQDLYTPTVYRASDHDPVIIGIDVTAAQSITFGVLANQPLSAGSVTLAGNAAVASSGLAVTFTTQTPSICTVTGNVVSLLAKGTCTLAANQAGDATWAPAPQVTQSFAVLLAQTITFNPLTDRALSAGTLTLAATASSGLPISYSAAPATVCTVAGNVVTLVAVGICAVTASQAGDGIDWFAATSVTQSFNVTTGTGGTTDVPIAPVWLILQAAVLGGLLLRRRMVR